MRPILKSNGGRRGAPAREDLPPAPRAPREPPGPLPTIAHYKSHGITSVLIYCAGLYCSRSSRVMFVALALPDDTPLVHIPRHRSFRCTRCGAREVEVRVDWPDPMVLQRRRATAIITSSAPARS